MTWWAWLLLGAWIVSWLVLCRDKSYINRGTDARILGGVGGRLQSFFSWPFAWLHARPLSVTFGTTMLALPPFLAINARHGDRWRTVRVGWRYDVNARRYIADVIIKLREAGPRYFVLALLVATAAACAKKAPAVPPATVRIVETVEVKVPVPVVRQVPPELLATLAPPLPVFVAPADPQASSALTAEGERLLRALLAEILGRIAAWEAWAAAPP